MVSSNTNKPDLTGELFYENEIKSNRIAAKALLLLGILQSVFVLCNIFIKNLLGGQICILVMTAASIISLAAFIIAKRHEYKSDKVKKTILLCVILTSGFMLFLYPLNAQFLLYGPIVISAMYYDAKLVKKTGIYSCIVYTAAFWINYIMDKTSDEIRNFHIWQGTDIFTSAKDLFISYYIPHLLGMLITAIICIGIARRGTEMVYRQSKNMERITKVETELNASFQIQMSSLPDPSYATDDGYIEINSRIRPAKTVGGDFYDYFSVGKNIFFLVADVSDKGLPAAMFMMKAKNAIRNAVINTGSLEKAVEQSNDVLCEDNVENMFVTLWIGFINKDSGVGKYINCGHEIPIVKRSDGAAAFLENNALLPIGIFPGISFESKVLMLNAGDSIAVYTDGLTDSENIKGEFFGAQKLIEAAQEKGSESAELCDILFNAADVFSGGKEQFDDMTALSLHVKNLDASKERILKLDNALPSAKEAVDAANELLLSVNCPEDVRRNIDVAIDELCINIIDYAYEGENGSFKISMHAGDNFMSIDTEDEGIPFNPLETESLPIEDIPRIGGLGIYLIKSISDEITYKYEEGKNKLHLMILWDAVNSAKTSDTPEN